MPPRKVKSIPVENTLNNVVDDENKEVSYDAVINLINEEKEPVTTDVEGLEDFIIPPTSNKVEKVIKAKKVRIVKTKEEPILVPDDSETEEPEVVEKTNDDDAKMKNDENIKVVELLQCDKCGKKLTARTLKYSHKNVCPANENKLPPKAKRVKQSDSKEDVVLDISDPPQPPTRVEKNKKRQEKFNTLFSGAV